MRNPAPSIPLQSRSAGIDAAIGQIDLIGEFGEILKSWRIRSPRCTLGSASDCSVQLTAPGIAPLHAVLIFGKKHTLLRSVGPTLISNRHVREWLIDQPTEIAVGQSRLVIHPSIGVFATVVHAENLIDQAARMCKDPTPLIPESPSAIVTSPHAPAIETHSEANAPLIDSAASARLETIERLLESLQVSLEKMQAFLGTEAKSANESIVESVTQEFDEFGKKLFTNLNDQLSNQTDVQQSLITHLADKFSDRFHAIDAQLNNQTGVQQSLFTNLADRFTHRLGAIDEQLSNQTGVQQSLFTNLADRFTHRLGAIDEQLNRFNEATSQHTSSLNDLLAQAGREQEVIENRFNEVISHRNELIDAVQVLRSEIALAYQAPEYQNLPSPNGSEVPEPTPDPTCVGEFAGEPTEYPCEPSPQSSVSDDQLAQSLERAQIQIQELNAQLRNLEFERDSAHLRVAHLMESGPSEQLSTQDSFESEPVLENQYGSLVESDDAVDVKSDELSEKLSDKLSDECRYPVATNEVASSDHNLLPAWFKQDTPAVSNVAWATKSSYPENSVAPLESESNFASFSAPDLTRYSDVGIESTPVESLDQPVESSNSNLDSISERLQRMLIDADHRRGALNPASELRTSSSWSQRYSNQPTKDLENSQPEPVDPYAFHSESVVAVEPDFHEPLVSEEVDSPMSSEEREAHFPNPSFEPTADESTDSVDQADRFGKGEVNRESDFATFDNSTKESSQPTPYAGATAEKRGSDEEESIEDYMQRLLHRVRGGAENPTNFEAKSVPTTPSPSGLTKPRSRVAASMGLEMPDSDYSSPAEKLSEELFVPRQQAPEQRNDLVALRELANTNARRAISRSDIRRTNSAFILKLGVTALAVSSAAALFMFNGLTLNAPFAGMVAAIVVAILWGYDCVHHFNRLKNAGGMNKVTAEETAAGQSIRVSSSDESGWRPTAD